jgi:hypothetical protein
VTDGVEDAIKVQFYRSAEIDSSQRLLRSCDRLPSPVGKAGLFTSGHGESCIRALPLISSGPFVFPAMMGLFGIVS